MCRPRFAAGQSQNVALIRSDTGLFARFHGRTGLVPRRAVVVSARAAGVPIIIATTISEIIIRMSLLLHQFLFRNAASRDVPCEQCCLRFRAFRLYYFPEGPKEDIMAWTTPVLVEICIGLEINGYMPADGYVPPEF